MSSSGQGYRLRPIVPADNERVADIIRQVMAEFGAVGEGYSSQDPEVDDMHGAYSSTDSAFWIVERDGRVLGCGGFGPLAGSEKRFCELRKMYFLPTLRGKGMGKRLLGVCLEEARRRGYRGMYLETLASMQDARRLYLGNGFRELDAPLGRTGHTGCNTWMFRPLDGTK